MNEQDIIMRLASYGDHIRRYELMIPNVFIQDDSEADLFCVRRSGLCDEFEVKTSRSDFLADKKKIVKFRELELSERGIIKWDNKASWPNSKKKIQALEDGDMCVNYFWYAVSENICTVDELPLFAGLILIKKDGRLKVVRHPKKLHKEKISFEDRYRIARKSNYRLWRSAKKLKIAESLIDFELMAEYKDRCKKAGL